jgi:hypothetical protein
MYPGVNVVVPNFSMKLSKSGSTVVLKVDLKKVPEQLINFQPTPTHIHLDTFKYSKKFVIHKAYPHNLTVDAGPDSYATVEYGMLTALLPVHGHEAATPNKLAGATSMANRDARKRNRDDESQLVAAKKKQKAPKGLGLAEKEAAKAAMVAAAEAAVSKVTRKPSPAVRHVHCAHPIVSRYLRRLLTLQKQRQQLLMRSWSGKNWTSKSRFHMCDISTFDSQVFDLGTKEGCRVSAQE